MANYSHIPESCHDVQHTLIVDGERMEVLYHGTKLVAAKNIFENLAFDTNFKIWFATRSETRLAMIFAQRACTSPQDKPAAVVIHVPERVTQNLRNNRLLYFDRFDPEDDPALRDKLQVVVEPAGVHHLNRYATRWDLYPATDQHVFAQTPILSQVD